jgi:hypothetical protein
MANYGVANSTTAGAGTAQLAISATYASQIAVAASSGSMVSNPVVTGLRRGKIYDILVGTNGTPADNYMEFECVRVTAGASVVWLGSISSVSSAFALDMADPGFSAFVTMGASAETNLALTAGQPWYVGVNQRASYRWVAAPGSEIVYPAVSSGTGGNGLALKARSAAYTGTATVNVLFQEQ